ncbi:MAG: putative 5,10-methylenetetrahydromethanopterin reductase [Acidimicrobiaceae bacterium]|nr:putative 5,10-methylenetetrahydromethanopterin reductase [Acidimicrobiaceae bacterium]
MLTTSLRLNNDTPAATFVQLAVVAEEAGFDQLWVSHDLLLRSAPVLLAAAAGATSRLRLGTGILNPYSAHPVELAMHAATLQEVSGGRAMLGLAAGAAEFLSKAAIKQDRPLARTREAVLACRALLDGGDPSELAGAGDWAPGTRLLVPNDVPVPIYLGAMSPKMLALAGEIADGALALLYPPEHYPVAAAQIAEGARSAGRDPAELDVPACVWVSIDEDRERAAAPLAEKLAFYGSAFAPYLLARAGLTPADFQPAAAALASGDVALARSLISPQMLSLGICGDPDDVVERCSGLVDAGATHLSFGPPLGPDPIAAVSLLGRRVIPRLVAMTPGV